MERLATYTSAPSPNDAHPVHGLHPYPAKFISQLPRAVITEHTNERSTILDPFCGSGTTLVESALLGRKSIGADSNPIATLASRAKTHALSSASIAEAERVLCTVGETNPEGIDVVAPRSTTVALDHWFQPNMIRELTWLRQACCAPADPLLRNLLLCVFSSIVVAASNQESDTRYKAIAKDLPDGYALKRFARKLSESLAAMRSFSADRRAIRNPPTILSLDATDLATKVPAASIDLIVTSPPYPNSYDYYLYHKLRLWWLGFDYRAVQQAEIGSRYEHSSRRAPVEVFTNRMRPVMSALGTCLKPSKLAYLFVGDSVIAGEHIDMGDLYAELAEAAGLGFVDATSYELTLVSRSFTATRATAGNGHGHRKLQHVVVLEGRGSVDAQSRRHIAKPASSEDPIDLEQVVDGSVVTLASDGSDRHVHSLAAYPSKFIPEIPRWAIGRYSDPGDIVLDPFAGSGTTAVEALLLGRSAVSTDLSPFAILTAQAKTTQVDEQELRAAALALERAAAEPSALPAAERLQFALDDFWFATAHLEEFARLLRFVDTEIPPHLSRFFRLVLASTIRSFSFQDPGQLKVKRDPRKVMRGTPSPSELLRSRLPAAVSRLLRFNELADGRSTHVAHTDSADDFLGAWPEGAADLVVTSPPYINAMNYPMLQRYELVLLGLVDHEHLRSHQAEYFGSERVYARDYATLWQFPDEHALAAPLNRPLREIYAKEPKRAFIAYRFFEQMDLTSRLMLKSVRPGGRLVMVAGTNVIRGVPLDTFSLLVQLLESHGAERELVFHYEILKQAFKLRRHETASMIPHDGVAVLRRAQ